MDWNTQNIRNFCIIAHIDHGKSTLADRLLEFTGTVSAADMINQVLDDMDLERERGITIKSHPIRMDYTSKGGGTYILNLIDTPGHVDFSYEVSRSLAACEGALLVVDAAQGIEAQTISNLFLALENNLTVIPVINKIDLKNAQIDVVTRQISELTGASEKEILLVSAKEGSGTEEVLEAIVDRIAPPSLHPDNPSRALIFDSQFDQYRGAVPYIRVFDGIFKQGMRIQLCSSGKEFEVDEVGIFRLNRIKRTSLSAGEVGYLVANIKKVSDTKVGDTIAAAHGPTIAPLPGYKEVKPMVFSGLYPTNSDDYEELGYALERLKLNDASLSYEPESSAALGFGFRCGFLGLLHMEIIQERLDREYGLDIITTVPNVKYRLLLTTGERIFVENPAAMPEVRLIEAIEEPYIKAHIIAPADYVGTVMKLMKERRSLFKTMDYLDRTKVDLHYELPFSEIVFDFYDRLKSVSRGYASFDYDYIDYRPSSLVKLEILLNNVPVDALSSIVHKDRAYEWGRELCQRLRTIIPRQLIQVVIQAAIGSRIIARESIAPLKKNVTAKCYGGDITRKRKLLERQKEGKKRMKQVGKVEIPQEAFLAILKAER
ncbi:MAG: elongation factor 4 [Gemmatimonadota bacterium]|nr:MAG: elongation factor 4 [Gemmatimonadota bacterium]